MEMENNCKNIKNPANAEYTINNVPSITEKHLSLYYFQKLYTFNSKASQMKTKEGDLVQVCLLGTCSLCWTVLLLKTKTKK